MTPKERIIEAMAEAIATTPVYRDYDAYRPTDYRKLAAHALDAALSVTDDGRPVLGWIDKQVGTRAAGAEAALEAAEVILMNSSARFSSALGAEENMVDEVRKFLARVRNHFADITAPALRREGQ